MMRRNGALLLVTLSACASHVRNPAQDPNSPTVPYVGNGGHSVPYVDHSQNGGQSQGQSQGQSAGNQPISPSAPIAQCQMRFDQIPIGGGYTVMSLLLNTSTYGTLTGKWGMDQYILKPWFSNSGVGTPVAQAAQDSPAWYRAIQYVNGNNSNSLGRMTWQDYYLGAKMAGVLVAMMATAQDPECTRMVYQYAQRVLGPNISELDAIPYQAAGELVHDKRIGPEFQKLDAQMKTLRKQLTDADKVIARQEKNNEYELKRLQVDLKDRYADIRADLVKIPPCADAVQLEALTSDPQASLKDRAETLVQTCQDKLSDRLNELRDQEVDLVAKAQRMKERGGNQNFAGSEEQRINDKLAKVQESTRKIQGYQQLLTTKDTTTSLTSQLESLDTVLAKQETLEKKDAFQDEIQRRNQIANQLKALNPRWVTYGYFGGFAVR